MLSENKPHSIDKIKISIVFHWKNKFPLFSTVGFSVEIERPWESFISKISSLTLCSMTISSYVLFISPPIYIEGRLRQGCSLKTCGRAGSRQEDNTLGRCGNIGWSFYLLMGVREKIAVNRWPTGQGNLCNRVDTILCSWQATGKLNRAQLDFPVLELFNRTIMAVGTASTAAHPWLNLLKVKWLCFSIWTGIKVTLWRPMVS